MIEREREEKESEFSSSLVVVVVQEEDFEEALKKKEKKKKKTKRPSRGKTMVLYSSSPPASWPAAAQCAVSGKTSSSSVAAAVVSTVGDVDLLLRTPQQTQASSSVPVKGGLTSLFANAGTKHAQNFSASLSDGYEVGMVRSHSQPELSHSMLLPWEGSESFSGGGGGGAGINIPISSSLRSRERSPVSVLQGPVSRSFSVGSPIHSLNARDSASSNGLPPLDPHSDRASRRRSSLTLDTRWPLSRSVGFEVGSEGVFHSDHHHSRPQVSGAVSQAAAVVAVDDDVPQLRHVEGFDPGTSHGRPNHSVKMEDPGMSEARDLVFGYAEKAKTIAAPASSAGVSHLNGVQCTPAESLLEAVQAQHKVFLEPCVIKAFRLAEDAHKGQVKDACFVCVSVDYALIPSSPVASQFLSSLLSILSVPLCTSCYNH